MMSLREVAMGLAKEPGSGDLLADLVTVSGDLFWASGIVRGIKRAYTKADLDRLR